MSTHTQSGDDQSHTPAVDNSSNDGEEGQFPPDSLILRLHRAFGPLAGGMILDAADLLTPGPVGLAGGQFVGMPVGWWISSIYGFTIPSRLLCATLAGVYCMTPGTELIPLATIISAAARFYAGEPEALRRDRARRAKSA
jgi:hypothetical protein